MRGRRGQRRWGYRAASLLWLVAIALLAWQSTLHLSWRLDWSATDRNTLAPASQRLLATLTAPIQVTAFLPADRSQERLVATLMERYRAAKDDVTLELIPLDQAPERARALAIPPTGGGIVRYGERSEVIDTFSERAISQALLRLSRPPRPVYFITGHGERKPDGSANHDLGVLGQELTRSGFQLATVNLISAAPLAPEVPLVLASPQVAPLAQEVAKLLSFLEQGGSLLWLTDPASPATLTPLTDYLTLTLLPGVVVDAQTSRFGINNPALIPVIDYGRHAVTAKLDQVTLFPFTSALEAYSLEPWEVYPLLHTQDSTWNETAPLDGLIRFDADDAQERAGPLLLAVAMEREQQGRRQRVAVVGDGDFLSNAYLGNGANLALGQNLFSWLASDDALMDIELKITPDRQLNLSPTWTTTLAGLFLVVLPLGFLITGALVWRGRRRR